MTTGFVHNEDELYDEVNKIDWTRFLNVDQTLAVTAVLNTENFNHSHYVGQKCKDAIVDQFRENLRMFYRGEYTFP